MARMAGARVVERLGIESWGSGEGEGEVSSVLGGCGGGVSRASVDAFETGSLEVERVE